MQSSVFRAALGCLVGLLSLGGCSMADGAAEMSEERIVGMPNPFIPCQSLEEAERVAGFAFAAPASLAGFAEVQYSAIRGQLVQLDFYSPDEGRAVLRKGAGSGDISGDYNFYPEDREVVQGNRVIRLRGREGKVLVATFAEQGSAYAVGFYGTAGLDSEEILKLVRTFR